MRNRIVSAWLALVIAMGGLLWTSSTPAGAAAVDKVLCRFVSSSASYATLYQDVNGLIICADMTANRFRLKPYAFTTNATMTVNDGDQVRIGSVAGNVTLTIPSAVTAGDGYVLDVQDIGGVLDGTHTVTIAATAGNINGSSTTSLATAYGGMRLISNGTNWFKR